MHGQDTAFSLPATVMNTVIETLRKRAFGRPDDVVFDEFKSPAEKHKPRLKRCAEATLATTVQHPPACEWGSMGWLPDEQVGCVKR